MYTQIVSKNELVINAEEEKEKKKRGEREQKREEKKTKTKTNGHGKHGEKGKTGGTTIELPTNTPALSTKQNKYDAKNQ